MAPLNGEFFKVSEFICRCGRCGRADISPRLIPILDRVRIRYQKPMIVTSGFRCPDYNIIVRGGEEHPKGEAADIAVYSSFDALHLVEVAILEDIRRLGIDVSAAAIKEGRAFIHLGISTILIPGIWTY